MNEEKFIPYGGHKKIDKEQMIELSEKFLSLMKKRRTIREYSAEDVPVEVILNCIEAAGRAPSGANKQPWFFAVVRDKKIKSEIRKLAEEEEKEFYGGKAPEEWLKDLEPFGTNADKPFLEIAPYLIVIFERKFDETDGVRHKNYYTKESVGIAAGMLITALHHAGLATLTHTPSPMNFLNEALGRPKNEKPYLILVTGFPAENVKVPNISKKSLEEISEIY